MLKVIDIKELKAASAKTGISVGAIYEIHKRTAKPYMWCGYFAKAKGFKCSPGYTYLHCSKYADEMYLRETEA